MEAERTEVTMWPPAQKHSGKNTEVMWPQPKAGPLAFVITFPLQNKSGFYGEHKSHIGYVPQISKNWWKKWVNLNLLNNSSD